MADCYANWKIHRDYGEHRSNTLNRVSVIRSENMILYTKPCLPQLFCVCGEIHFWTSELNWKCSDTFYLFELYVFSTLQKLLSKTHFHHFLGNHRVFDKYHK